MPIKNARTELIDLSSWDDLSSVKTDAENEHKFITKRHNISFNKIGKRISPTATTAYIRTEELSILRQPFITFIASLTVGPTTGMVVPAKNFAVLDARLSFEPLIIV